MTLRDHIVQYSHQYNNPLQDPWEHQKHVSLGPLRWRPWPVAGSSRWAVKLLLIFSGQLNLRLFLGKQSNSLHRNSQPTSHMLITQFETDFV